VQTGDHDRDIEAVLERLSVVLVGQVREAHV
jgi:hypothetical protein